jgi:hypothetical protein
MVSAGFGDSKRECSSEHPSTNMRVSPPFSLPDFPDSFARLYNSCENDGKYRKVRFLNCHGKLKIDKNG